MGLGAQWPTRGDELESLFHEAGVDTGISTTYVVSGGSKNDTYIMLYPRGSEPAK